MKAISEQARGYHCRDARPGTLGRETPILTLGGLEVRRGFVHERLNIFGIRPEVRGGCGKPRLDQYGQQCSPTDESLHGNDSGKENLLPVALSSFTLRNLPIACCSVPP